MGNPMPETIYVTESDGGSQVTLKPGQEMVVRLGSNPSTGFRWQVEKVDEAVLQQVGMAQYEPAEPGETLKPGQAGQETMRFQAAGAGQTNLILAYRRPWEGEIAAEKTFTLHVVVR